MHIELQPNVEAVLRAQVAAGHFASIEEALKAAVLGMPLHDDAVVDLAWAAPYLAAADAEIAAGQTIGEDEAFSELELRFGKL